ncbi:protein ANTI-SILENCING 1 [Sesamum alatum]|uniref:Protein ANTI-SILENCING 1 n=1 Tax=Sesamum alatum TaxID=300844 RepID=A0AAE2CFA6_9LAMI|nr:protein ANTI-SILENCING 1 [Sesamum alatum]
MSPSLEAETLEEPEFKWGKKRGIGGRKSDVQFYESFSYDGLDYSLYDCVYMYKQGEREPYVGKLVKIWENADKSKKIKVQWFFRPSEISYYLRDAKVLENELFLASGDGIGLANINPLEAIAGKCNVVCISTDSRNPQPSAEELQMANYVFYRIFDVKSCTISDQMDDTIGGLKVEFVFNRAESVGTLGVPTLVSNSKDEARNVIACKETLKLLGNNSTQQLNNVKRDENGNPVLEKEGTDLKQAQVKLESLLGDDSSCADVNANKTRETTGTIENTSTLGAENVGCRVSTEKNKVKDNKTPINQVQVEKRMSSAGTPGNIDDTPLKRVKLDGMSSSSKGKDSNGVQSLTIPGKDAARPVIDATSSEAKLKSELFKNSVGSAKDVKLAEKSSFLDEKLSNTSFSLPKENPRPGHADDAAGLVRDTKFTKGLKAKEEKPSKINAERPPTANVVSPNETARLSTIDVPNEAPKSGSNMDLEGSGQSAKLVKSSSASLKRPLDTSTRLSKEKSNARRDACHENKDAILDNDSCPMEGGRPKRKYDDSLKISKDNNNNTSVKFREKTSLGETKSSPKLAISHDKKEKSRLGEGSSNENHNEKVGKLSNDNLPNLLVTTTDGGGKNVEGRLFEVTRRPIAEKSKWMKLPWEEQMKTAHDQGRLVLLQNLDPEYTSAEVQDIISSAFEENCAARMVQHTATSSPHSAVDRVVKKLNDECLMLPNKRPLVVCTGVFPQFSEKRTTFVGHLVIDKARRQVQREMKEAVSTSHYSQNNTIEYEMAMAWCLLQSKSDKWWEKLYEQQGKELNKLVSALKSK